MPKSHDGDFVIAPCQVQLRNGDVLPRVYVVEATSFLRNWGHDPSRSMLDITTIEHLEDSPLRLPAQFANELYAEGESGMGYVMFTVVLRDGRRLPFVTGNAVDFPNWPSDVKPADVVAVLPHTGRPEFRDRAPHPTESSADYLWCLYSFDEQSSQNAAL